MLRNDMKKSNDVEKTDIFDEAYLNEDVDDTSIDIEEHEETDSVQKMTEEEMEELAINRSLADMERLAIASPVFTDSKSITDYIFDNRHDKKTACQVVSEALKNNIELYNVVNEPYFNQDYFFKTLNQIGVPEELQSPFISALTIKEKMTRTSYDEIGKEIINLNQLKIDFANKKNHRAFIEKRNEYGSYTPFTHNAVKSVLTDLIRKLPKDSKFSRQRQIISALFQLNDQLLSFFSIPIEPSLLLLAEEKDKPCDAVNSIAIEPLKDTSAHKRDKGKEKIGEVDEVTIEARTPAFLPPKKIDLEEIMSNIPAEKFLGQPGSIKPLNSHGSLPYNCFAFQSLQEKELGNQKEDLKSLLLQLTRSRKNKNILFLGDIDLLWKVSNNTWTEIKSFIKDYNISVIDYTPVLPDDERQALTLSFWKGFCSILNEPAIKELHSCKILSICNNRRHKDIFVSAINASSLRVMNIAKQDAATGEPSTGHWEWLRVCSGDKVIPLDVLDLNGNKLFTDLPSNPFAVSPTWDTIQKEFNESPFNELSTFLGDIIRQFKVSHLCIANNFLPILEDVEENAEIADRLWDQPFRLFCLNNLLRGSMVTTLNLSPVGVQTSDLSTTQYSKELAMFSQPSVMGGEQQTMLYDALRVMLSGSIVDAIVLDLKEWNDFTEGQLHDLAMIFKEHGINRLVLTSVSNSDTALFLDEKHQLSFLAFLKNSRLTSFWFEDTMPEIDSGTSKIPEQIQKSIESVIKTNAKISCLYQKGGLVRLIITHAIWDNGALKNTANLPQEIKEKMENIADKISMRF